MIHVVVAIYVETTYPRAVSVRVVTVIVTVADSDPLHTRIKICRRNLYTYTLRLFVNQYLLIGNNFLLHRDIPLFVFDAFEAIDQPARCMCGYNRVTATQQHEQ